MPSYERQFSHLANSLVYQLIREGKVETEKKPGCPNCKYRSIYKRKIKPTYKCQRCGHEFNDPVMVSTDRVSKETYRAIILEHKEEIKKIVDAKRDDFFQNSYKMFEDCIVLCNKCHLLNHNGYDLCPQCKKPKKKEYDVCWDCLIKTPKGQKIKEDYEEYKKFEERMEEFEEMADQCYELEAKGEKEAARKLYDEWMKNHPDFDEDEGADF